MKKIMLHPSFMAQIAKEQDCTAQSVRMALQYVFNSPKAIAIRQRAKELLKMEAESVEL
jgi:hypothetical protein